MSEVYVSSASVWEIAIKVRSGKWPEAVDILAEIESRLESERFWPLPVTIAHAKRSGEFTSPHRDPFDRLLAAQADIEDLTLVTADRQFAGFPVKTIW